MDAGHTTEYACSMSARRQTGDPGPAISVLIADDQALVRAGFRAILESQPGITVCGEAADGRAAIDLVRTGTIPMSC